MNFSLLRTCLLALCLAVVAGCGGGGSDSAGTSVVGGGAGSPIVGGSSATLTLAVQLVDSAGNPTTAVVAGQPVQAVAVLKSNGQALAGQIVQFSLEQSVDLVKLDPASGSLLTDDSGRAIITVASLGASTGAGRVKATSTVSGKSADGAANFFTSGSVGSQPASLTLGPIAFDSTSVSAYGTTGVTVQVLQNGAPYTSPVTVAFTTSCAAGKSTMTPSATTRPDGKAVGTFVDNGCAQVADANVTITATISTGTVSKILTVRAPTAGSLRFVSAVPADKSITLRGQGGNGRQENATLTYKLVDVAGNGVGDADVCFDATTYVGGLNLDGFSPPPGNLPTTQGSDALCKSGSNDLISVINYVKRTNADGTVSIQINSGTVPTPVRVRAQALYPTSATSALATYSDTLSISTGLPIQRSFSLSIDQANIDGGDFDGVPAVLTIRLADQFSNPVPDGTVVNFVGSGGAVCTADNGSCKTVNGACSCTFNSQERRPLDNRVVVTAYAVGLEDFEDRDGDNLYTPFPNSVTPQLCTSLVDPTKDCFYDLGDVFVDANKDAHPGSGSIGTACPGGPANPTINGDTDILIPYQQNSVYRCSGDGVRGTAHIRASTVIYLSHASSAGDPTVILPLSQLSQEFNMLSGTFANGYFLRLQPNCPEGAPVPQGTLTMFLEDGIGNPMAAATKLLPVDPSDNVAPGGFRPSSVLAIGTRSPSPTIDLPNVPKIPDPQAWTLSDPKGAVTTGHSIIVRGVSKKCFGDGSFSMSVQSPRGGDVLSRILYDGESRSTSRFAFDIRYRTAGFNVNVSNVINATRTVVIDSALLVAAVGVGAPSSYVIDWGDSSSTSGAGSTIAVPDRQHVYAASGTYQVSVTATAGGVAYSGSSVVVVP